MQTAKKPVSAGHRLDPKVVITLLAVAVVSLVIFGFRFMSNKPCKPVDIAIDATSLYTGVPIRFSCTAGAKDDCKWVVGDPQGKILSGQTALYTYTEPGQYLIELTVNDRCKEYKYLTIEKAPKFIDPDLIPHIICPQTVDMGKPVIFRDSTRKATSWEWRFGETGAIDAVTSTATYTFNRPGLAIVTLVVNGNPDLNAQCKVFVNDKSAAATNASGPPLPNIGSAIKAQPNTEELSKSTRPPAITSEEFSNMLMEVVKGKLVASAFSIYLCDYLTIPVKYKVEGSREKTVSFQDACSDLLGMKRVKKIVSNLGVQESTGCMTDITIRVEKRTF
jgi:hypothetical protein